MSFKNTFCLSFWVSTLCSLRTKDKLETLQEPHLSRPSGRSIRCDLIDKHLADYAITRSSSPPFVWLQSHSILPVYCAMRSLLGQSGEGIWQSERGHSSSRIASVIARRSGRKEERRAQLATPLSDRRESMVNEERRPYGNSPQTNRFPASETKRTEIASALPLTTPANAALWSFLSLSLSSPPSRNLSPSFFSISRCTFLFFARVRALSQQFWTNN